MGVVVSSGGLFAHNLSVEVQTVCLVSHLGMGQFRYMVTIICLHSTNYWQQKALDSVRVGCSVESLILISC